MFFKSGYLEIRNPKVWGLALHRAWIVTFFFASRRVIYANPSTGNLLEVYTISLLSLVLVLLIAGLLPDLMKSFMGMRAIKIASPLTMSVGSLLLLPTIYSSGAPLFCILCGISTGIASGLMLLYWGEFYGKSNARAAQVESALAFALAVFIYAVFLFLFSLELFIVAATILPLLSGFALFKAFQKNDSNERKLRPIPTGERGMLRVAAAALIISFVNFACQGITRNYSPAATQPSLLAAETFYTLTLLFSTLILAILIITTIFLSSRSDLGLIYRFVLLFFIVGALFAPFANEIRAFSSVVKTAGFSCFELIFWIALSNISYRYHVQPLRVFGFGRAGWSIGVYLGGFFPPSQVLDNTLSNSASMPYFLASILIILIVIAYAFILPERSIITITTGFAGKKSSLQSRCAKLSHQFGLSQREGEVLTHLVKGRDLTSIKKALNISGGTVSTHRQRIYQKTGVHSRQELLDLLEQINLEDLDQDERLPGKGDNTHKPTSNETIFELSKTSHSS